MKRRRHVRFIRLVQLSILAWPSLLFSLRAASAQTQIFFNEIHYDNDGTDTGEAIEIAGPAGTDLTGWSIVLYNGSGGTSYDTKFLNGVIPNSNGTGFGVVVVSYPANGIQNGSPDGMALVNGLTVVQFLSYEGVFTATNGPAAGLSSIDIGVAETATTPVGHSLQLSGAGATYEDFIWQSPAANTFGAFNNNQTFSAADAAPSISATTPANNATNVATNVNLVITFSEAVNVSGNWFSIAGSNSGSHAATVSGGPITFTLDPAVDFVNNENVNVTVFAANVTDQDVADPPDTMAANFNFSFATIASDAAPAVASTTPANGASGVEVNTNLIITFSEPVNVSGNWFSISGGSSGSHTATVSGGPTSFTLDPDGVFVNNESVTVTIFAANVTDRDADDPPDNMAADYTFSFTTPSLIINEILADPSSTNGDANGDGIINTSQDEFVELVNVSGAALDISGWTLSDAVQVRHTFPAGTIMPDLCAVVVFAGGTPTGAFGNAIVEVASNGQLGLNNAGDTVILKNGATTIATYTFGAEGGNDQSLTRDPDITGATPLVQHTTATGAGGRLHSPGTKVDGAQFPGCAPPKTTKEIFEIQGNGLVSPFADQTVTTENNVVTVIGPNGFFMQTPAARSDNNAHTSDGIFVFTSSAPAVSVGDLVNVTGRVSEFFNFTEFNNNPMVTVTSSGNPLPPPIQFDNMTPSPNLPQSIAEFERFESMLVQIENGVVAASNQTFSSDRFAEVLIAAGSRPFREPGIKYPGLANLPVWDGNPEIFEFDPDRLGQSNMVIPAGSTFSATGVLGFEFGDYELWPTSYTVDPMAFPRAVRTRHAGESTIATLNLHLFYDTINDPGSDEVRTPQQYADKLNKLSMYIRTLLDAPDILAVQEAEKLRVLQDLANKITADDTSLIYTPYLIEGNDISGLDVGFLLRRDVTVDAVSQLGATEIFAFDNTLLHDRPPLLLEAKLADGYAVSVLAVHLRSLIDIDSPSEGPRVRQKRHQQAVSVSNMVQILQTSNPNINLAVAGDFNAFQFTDGYVHVLGQIIGAPANASEALIPGTDNVNPDLINAALSLPANEQYSFVFEGSAQALDHILISQKLQPAVTGIQYVRANSDAAEIFETDATTALRASDHDGLVLFVKKSPPNAVASSEQLSVSSYQLEQNYPNPFSQIPRFAGNPSTRIAFSLEKAGEVNLSIYNINGQEVRSLISGRMNSGHHAIMWNGHDNAGKAVPSGIYFYKLRVNGFAQTRKMTLMR
jgi:predicted extracellular nuclease